MYEKLMNVNIHQQYTWGDSDVLSSVVISYSRHIGGIRRCCTVTS